MMIMCPERLWQKKCIINHRFKKGWFTKLPPHRFHKLNFSWYKMKGNWENASYCNNLMMEMMMIIIIRITYQTKFGRFHLIV